MSRREVTATLKMPDHGVAGAPEIARKPQIAKPVAFGVAMVLLFFGGLVGWGATAPLDSAAIAQGQVGIDTNRKAIQHLEGGIVKEIRVRERDAVVAGQVLIVLDDTQAKAKIQNLKAQIEADTLQRKLVEQEEIIVQDMHKKGNATLPRLLQLQRRKAELDGSLAQARAQLSAAEDVLARIEIRAPIGGVIVGLQVHTPGGVVAAGTTLMEIVPRDEALVVEARVDPNDIDVVQPGQTAFVRFTPYSYRYTLPEKGTVTWVSADRFTDQKTGQAYYLARIAIEKPENQIGIRLYPGMPIEAMIVTGSRSALAYFLAPIRRSLNRAFRQD